MFVFCCVDTNQCASGNGGCAHICTDTLPGYACSCNDGFTLSTDGHNCTGEAENLFLYIEMLGIHKYLAQLCILWLRREKLRVCSADDS